MGSEMNTARFYRNALASLLRGICSTTYFPESWEDMDYVHRAKEALATTPPTDCRVDEAAVDRAVEAMNGVRSWSSAKDYIRKLAIAALSTRLAPVDGLTEELRDDLGRAMAKLNRCEGLYAREAEHFVEAALRRLAAAQVQDKDDAERAVAGKQYTGPPGYFEERQEQSLAATPQAQAGGESGDE